MNYSDFTLDGYEIIFSYQLRDVHICLPQKKNSLVTVRAWATGVHSSWAHPLILDDIQMRTSPTGYLYFDDMSRFMLEAWDAARAEGTYPASYFWLRISDGDDKLEFTKNVIYARRDVMVEKDAATWARQHWCTLNENRHWETTIFEYVYYEVDNGFNLRDFMYARLDAYWSGPWKGVTVAGQRVAKIYRTTVDGNQARLPGKWFWFFNNFSVLEGIKLQGVLSRKRSLDFDHAQTTSENVVYNKKRDYEYEYDTGLINLHNIAWIEDFLTSPEIYFFDDSEEWYMDVHLPRWYMPPIKTSHHSALGADMWFGGSRCTPALAAKYKRTRIVITDYELTESDEPDTVCRLKFKFRYRDVHIDKAVVSQSFEERYFTEEFNEIFS